MNRKQLHKHCGILAIDKPISISSHDLVNKVRRITGERRVGHAGTLDPAASGLMFLCVGFATRLTQFLTQHYKSYDTRIIFGVSTDTDDSEGHVIGRYACNQNDALLKDFYDSDPQEILASIKGKSYQVPPMFSAIKKSGVKAYEAARKGKSFELEKRPIHVYKADFLGSGSEYVTLKREQNSSALCQYNQFSNAFKIKNSTNDSIHATSSINGSSFNDAAGFRTNVSSINRTESFSNSNDTPCNDNDIAHVELPYWDVHLKVSKGTYIRAIARDLGKKFGCGAHVSALRRTSIYSFTIDDAFTLEDVQSYYKQNGDFPWVNPIDLLGFPAFTLSEDEYIDIKNGKSLNKAIQSDGYVSLVYNSKLIAIASSDGHKLCPKRVLAQGVCGVD